MEFSEFFLNKLLEGAVSFYRNNKDIYVNPIPEKFKNIDESIEFFKNALIKEAHNSLKNEIKVVDSPILHAVNLDTTRGGNLTDAALSGLNDTNMVSEMTGDDGSVNIIQSD